MKNSKNYILGLALAVSFLFAANAKADVVSPEYSWDLTHQAPISQHIVSFTSKDGNLHAGIIMGVGYEYVGNAYGGTINNTYDVHSFPGVFTSRMRPAEMEFGVHENASHGFDLGFNVKVTASNWDNFMDALTIQVVQYGENGTQDEYLYHALASSLNWNDGTQGDDSIGWLNGFGNDLLTNDGNTFLRFFVNPNYTGDYSIEVYGAATPEPATLAMLGLGLAGLGIARRRMKR